MCPVISLFALLLAAEPTVAVVGPGETLAQVARRTLGDERAASELKALNSLSSDELPEGAKLKLPGPERASAASTIKTARNALSQAQSPEERRKQAEEKLKQAEELFAQARYREAERAADAAWGVVSQAADGKTRFSVEVSKEGHTRVKSVSGLPVRVEAQGVSQPVHAGQEVRVEKGAPPPPPDIPEPPLPAPTPVAPEEKAQLVFKATQRGLGPVHLAWTPVAGAGSYEVTVVGANKRETVVTATRPGADLPPLKEGRYQWSVRAVAGDRRSEPSAQRTFELLQNLNIEAKTNWK